MAHGVLDHHLPRTFLGLAVLMIILSGLFVGCRFYSKVLRRRKFTLDDWLALGALFFYYIEMGCHLWGLISGGLAQHINKVSPDQVIVLFKQLTVLQFPYPFVLAMTRISICVLMLQIFIQKWFKISVYICICLTLAWFLFLIIDGFAICRPFAANWNENLPDARCGDKDASYIANAAWGIILDGMIWLLPHPLVWKLQMPVGQKIALSAIFTLGIFDIAVAIVRIVSLLSLDVQGDVTYTLGPVEIWSFIECGVAIIIACIPVCKPIFEALLPRSILNWAKSQVTGGKSVKRSYGKVEDDHIELVHTNGPPKASESSAKAEAGSEVGVAGGTTRQSRRPTAWDEEDIAVTSDITVIQSQSWR